jgi:hypothetical protein
MHRLPNIPGFYMLFRTYSHYRAYYGSKHLEELVSRNLITPKPSPLLDQIYSTGLSSKTKYLPPAPPAEKKDSLDIASQTKSQATTTESINEEADDILYLNKNSGSLIADAFESQAMAIEIERAVEQVEKAMKEEQKVMSDTEKKEQPL